MSDTKVAKKVFFDGQSIAFVGGGNMASAILGGLLGQGIDPVQIRVVEPFEAARAKLQAQWALTAMPVADHRLNNAALVVWATKPQVLREAIAQTVPHLSPSALHLSIAAGVGSGALQRWLHTERIVRAMPNTPALIAKGMTGLFALPKVDKRDKAWINDLVATLGQGVWLDAEAHLDAVTALSGSGPAYVFMFAKAMVAAGVEMGLEEALARRLVLATFEGATALAGQSDETLDTLMAQVTSKGGTTYAALTTMQAKGVDQGIVAGTHAAQQRAVELGQQIDLD